jgi:excisionase family DNA binding protein
MKRLPQPNLLRPPSPITPNRRIPVKPKSEPLLTLQDLATRWQVSLKSVRRIVARGELKVHRIGHQIRISVEDLNAYEKLHRE